MGVSYVLEGGSWGGVPIFSLSFLGDGRGKISPSDAVQRGRRVPMSCISAVGVVGRLVVFGVFRKSEDTGITK